MSLYAELNSVLVKDRTIIPDLQNLKLIISSEFSDSLVHTNWKTVVFYAVILL